MASLALLRTFICLAFGLILSVHAGIIFDPIKSTCGPAGGGGNVLLSDVIAMANSALNYMNNAVSNQQSSDPKDHWDYYRVMTAFDVLFDGQSPGADVRWSTVQNNLQALANLANNQPDVYVLCDDTQFWTVSPSNGQPTAFNNPVDNQQYQYPNGLVTCADSVNGLFQIAYRINIGGTEFISICSKQNSLAVNLGALSYGEGSVLDSQGTWSTTFFHEMMHVLPLGQVGDSAGGTAAGGERYGWNDAVGIRSTYGETNPDSTKLFAMAMSMEEWMWHSGIAVSFNAEYTRLSAIQNDPTITNLNLPSPAPGPWT